MGTGVGGSRAARQQQGAKQTDYREYERENLWIKSVIQNCYTGKQRRQHGDNDPTR